MSAMELVCALDSTCTHPTLPRSQPNIPASPYHFYRTIPNSTVLDRNLPHHTAFQRVCNEPFSTAPFRAVSTFLLSHAIFHHVSTAPYQLPPYHTGFYCAIPVSATFLPHQFALYRILPRPIGQTYKVSNSQLTFVCCYCKFKVANIFNLRILLHFIMMSRSIKYPSSTCLFAFLSHAHALSQPPITSDPIPPPFLI